MIVELYSVGVVIPLPVVSSVLITSTALISLVMIAFVVPTWVIVMIVPLRSIPVVGVAPAVIVDIAFSIPAAVCLLRTVVTMSSEAVFVSVPLASMMAAAMVAAVIFGVVFIIVLFVGGSMPVGTQKLVNQTFSDREECLVVLPILRVLVGASKFDGLLGFGGTGLA